MLLHALYERLCTAPSNRLPCYGALEVIVTLLLLLLLLTQVHLEKLPLNQRETDYRKDEKNTNTHAVNKTILPTETVFFFLKTNFV